MNHGISVLVKKSAPGETQEVDKALKRLKAKIDREGILDEVRMRRNFLNKSQKQKLKQKLAAKKAKIQRENRYR